MIVVPFSSEHYRGVNWSELTEGMVLGNMPEDLRAWGLKQAEHGWGFTGLEQDRAIFSAGILLSEKGVGHVWALFSPQAQSRGVKILRLLAQGLADLAVNLHLHQIQAMVRADVPKARKLVEHLGFEEEKPIMHGYGSDSADCHSYVRRTCLQQQPS